MIGKNQSPSIGKHTRFKVGYSGNPLGRPKGTKNLSTIVRELENEDFDWNQLIKSSNKLREEAEIWKNVGSPLRAIVYKAFIDALLGKPTQQASAREFLRRAGYGNKIEVEKPERERREPVVVSRIKPRSN